jgi:hypothetical protein
MPQNFCLTAYDCKLFSGVVKTNRQRGLRPLLNAVDILFFTYSLTIIGDCLPIKLNSFITTHHCKGIIYNCKPTMTHCFPMTIQNKAMTTQNKAMTTQNKGINNNYNPGLSYKNYFADYIEEN